MPAARHASGRGPAPLHPGPSAFGIHFPLPLQVHRPLRHSPRNPFPPGGTGRRSLFTKFRLAQSVQRSARHKKTGEANLSGIGSRPVSRVLYPCGRLSFIQAAGYPTAQATYPGATGRAGPLPYLVLLQTGFAWLAVSPRRPVGSYSTLSPLPVRRTAVWRSAFCCAFQRSLSLGVTQRFALRSPDFPLRVWPYGLTRNDSPSDSRNVFQPLQDPFLGAGACWQKQYYSRHAARLDRRSLHAPQKAGSQRRQQTTTRRTPPTRRYCLRCRKSARSSKSDAGS